MNRLSKIAGGLEMALGGTAALLSLELAALSVAQRTAQHNYHPDYLAPLMITSYATMVAYAFLGLDGFVRIAVGKGLLELNKNTATSSTNSTN